VQGRSVSELDLELIRQWVAQNPGWSRWRLSRELAARWDWRNGVGQFKDMAARTLLVKLHQRGLIALPARRQAPTNRMRCPASRPAAGAAADFPCHGSLAQLGPLTLCKVSGSTPNQPDINQSPQLVQSRKAHQGRLLPNHRLAISGIEHPFGQSGGGFVRQQDMQSTG
jgi:hypothetical protein